MLRQMIVAIGMAAVAAPAFGVTGGTAGDVAGRWSGTGFIQSDPTARRMNVRCAIDGEQSGNTLGFDGECRAALVLKRAIGIRLTRDGDHFSGTYIGTIGGASKLDGVAATPDRWVLTMTLPREIHGDDKAKMVIETLPDGTFTITTTDRMDGGDEMTTSKVTFTKG